MLGRGKSQLSSSYIFLDSPAGRNVSFLDSGKEESEAILSCFQAVVMRRGGGQAGTPGAHIPIGDSSEQDSRGRRACLGTAPLGCLVALFTGRNLVWPGAEEPGCWDQGQWGKRRSVGVARMRLGRLRGGESSYRPLEDGGRRDH